MLALLVLLAGIILNGGGCPNIFSKCLSKEKREKIRTTAFKLINLDENLRCSQALRALKDSKAIDVVAKTVAEKLFDEDKKSVKHKQHSTSAASKDAGNQGHEVSKKPLLNASNLASIKSHRGTSKRKSQDQSNSEVHKTNMMDALKNALQNYKHDHRDSFDDLDEKSTKNLGQHFTGEFDPDFTDDEIDEGSPNRRHSL
jgi:NADPH:quinone reductase-like Zn-dependent oxidoreductase